MKHYSDEGPERAARERMRGFLALSASLTGYSETRLQGTGQAGPHLATLLAAAGEEVADALIFAHRAAAQAARDEDDLERRLRRDVMSDERLGPVARSLVKTWFLGTWHALPARWHAAFGVGAADRTHVVSPDAFVEGLLWPCVGANPPGAKPFGYGSWAAAPRQETP